MRNGQKKAVAELVKNKDFFEFKDGIYYTMEALCSKYDCQHTHIYRRRKEFDIPQQTVLGVTVIKDDERFVKLPKANNLENAQGVKLTSYAELHRSVEVAIEAMTETNKLHGDWYGIHNQEISKLVYEVKDNNRLLTQILDHLTKEKTNASTSQKE